MTNITYNIVHSTNIFKSTYGHLQKMFDVLSFESDFECFFSGNELNLALSGLFGVESCRFFIIVKRSNECFTRGTDFHEFKASFEAGMITGKNPTDWMFETNFTCEQIFVVIFCVILLNIQNYSGIFILE